MQPLVAPAPQKTEGGSVFLCFCPCPFTVSFLEVKVITLLSADKSPTASVTPTITSFLSFCCLYGILLFSLVSDFQTHRFTTKTHRHTHLKLQTTLPTGLQDARPCQDLAESVSVVCQDLKFNSVCCGLSRVGGGNGGTAWGLLSSLRAEPGLNSSFLLPSFLSPQSHTCHLGAPLLPMLVQGTLLSFLMSSPILAFLRVFEHHFSKLSFCIPINEA